MTANPIGAAISAELHRQDQADEQRTALPPRLDGRPRPHDCLDELLADADASRDTRAARHAKRIRETAGQLRARLADVAAEQARRRQAEREAATLRAKEAQLRKQLDEVRSQLRAVPSPTNHRAQKGGQARWDAYRDRLAALGATGPQIRDWARANGVPCTPTGVIPNAVLDAYARRTGNA